MSRRPIRDLIFGFALIAIGAVIALVAGLAVLAGVAVWAGALVGAGGLRIAGLTFVMPPLGFGGMACLFGLGVAVAGWEMVKSRKNPPGVA
jgi:hypothetical protein